MLAVQPSKASKKSGYRRYNHRLLLEISGGGRTTVAHQRLLLANSLVPSWQTPDTLDELPMHFKQVLNRIVLTLA
ncbi:hypothetical protein GW17_00043458 [Ensete ventricosum]|nr:hypothetical protein GW17_00043458 [Ensete ventricosum]RZR84269.1 hypothetical protein BHM03_00011053 [Ensete ventricosum]